MNDDGAGGGCESHMAAHTRKQSENEAIPTNTEATKGNGTSKSENQDSFSEVSQGYPRDWPANVQEVQGVPGSSTPTPMTLSQGSQRLSRNPSSRSNSPATVRHTEQFTASECRTSNACVEPPVTKATLSELDVNKIIHNPKLRHDINFDPELHFRPNLDGEKGKKKKDKADMFWAALKEQLVMFAVDREAFYRTIQPNEDWCLPSLLRAVKEIIQTLVPQRDRDFLNDGLNVDLLMQQFNRGVADLEKLASWLSSVLKLHCAPMRDEWVDRMYNYLSNGNRNNDIDELVTGLRELLSVLEAMKLDVANHQIRCLRPVLIEDTVHFEQRFFHKKIQTKKVETRAAYEWYREGRSVMESYDAPQHVQAFGEMACFFHGLTHTILPSSRLELPNTFLFDEERIMKLRSDLYDSICLEICMRKYEEFERLSRVSHLFSSVPAYVAEEAGNRNSFPISGEFNFNTPVNSRPSSLTFSDRASTPSSSRPSSGFLFSQPASDTAESQSKAMVLYNSLVALLNTAPALLMNDPTQRWLELSQSMALQILRFVDVPHYASSSLAGFGDQLCHELCDPRGDMFRRVEMAVQKSLMADLANRVQEFKNLSGVGIFSVATGGRITGPGRAFDAVRERAARGGITSDSQSSAPRDPREEAGIDDMAIRLAHLGILHWRVWGHLVYLNDTAAEHSSDSHINNC